MKRLLVFDLDGTLAESKCPISSEMDKTLSDALNHFSIAIISGGAYPQFEKQFLGNLHLTQEKLQKLFLFPTCATSFYKFNRVWEKIYSEELTKEEREKIIDSFHKMFKDVDYTPFTGHGEVIEDRLTQITFSALGQQAPVALKKDWDPAHTKRLAMIEILKKYIPEFEIRTGGSTSIDVTKKGIDKAYGIYQIEKLLSFKLEEMLFIGDALFEGGNDFPVRKTGVDCVQVANPKETLSMIKTLIQYAEP